MVPPVKFRYVVLVALIGGAVVLTPLRAPFLEFALARDRREFSAWDLSFEVGVDSVRAIRVRGYLFNFIDQQHMVEVACDRARFDALVERYRMVAVESESGSILRRMGWKMATWWPVLMRRPQVFATKDLKLDRRGGDGLHFAGFYDEPSKSMYLWVRNNF